MSTTDTPTGRTDPGSADPGTAVAMDRADERLQARDGLGGYVRALVDRAKDGDLGVLPVVIGLAVIWTVFQILNPIFLSSQNLVNLTMECAAVGVISLGIVFMLLVGQIDLSVGSVSGLSAAILATLFVTRELPAWIALLAAVTAGAVIGLLYSLLFNRFGVPSFVITLGGLLTFLGVQLLILGDQGSINIPFDSGLVNFAQLAFMPDVVSYVLVLLAAGGMFLTGVARARERRAAGLSSVSMSFLLIRSTVLLVGLGFVAWYLNQARGIGWMFVFFLGLILVANYLLTRTKWGRSFFSVGGNAEAARRAGINVKAVYRWALVLCSTLAAVGGILAAARLAAANQSSGTGDVNLNAIAAAVIGGTSLFGGRGSAFSALLGIVVIQSISSGLTLLNLSSSFRFGVTGLVLVAAVTIDSISRRSRASHGR